MTCLIRVVQGLIFQSLVIRINKTQGFTFKTNAALKVPVGSYQMMQRLHPLQMKPFRKETTENKNIKRHLNEKFNGDFYNDDAFGLVFLTSSLVIHDFYFCITFLSLTAFTATLVNTGKIRFSPLLPGFVGVATIVLRVLIPWLSSKAMIVDVELLISSLINSLGIIEYENNDPTSDLLPETLLSSISFIWAFYNQRKE